MTALDNTNWSKLDTSNDLTQHVAVDVRSACLTIWRGKFFTVAITTFFILAAAVYGFLVAVPKYSATASVILETREEQVVELSNVLSGLSGDASVVTSEVEVLRSRSLLGRVVQDLSLHTDPEFNVSLQPETVWDNGKRYILTQVFELVGISTDNASSTDSSQNLAVERAVDQLRKVLVVNNLPQSVVFDVRVTTNSAEKSALIANSIAERYILEQLEVKFEATEQATSWLSGRVGDLRKDLEAKQERLARHASETDLINAASLEALVGQLEELRRRVAEEETALVRARARVETLESAPSEIQRRAILAEDRTLTRLAARIEADQGNRTLIRAFDQRYAQVKIDARNQVTRGESQLAALRTSGPALVGQIDEQSASLAEREQIEREVEASALIYEYFLNRLKETSVQQGIQQPDARILSKAVIPSAPSEPRRYLLIAVASVLGFLGAISWLLVRESLLSTFRSADQLEAETGLSVLGQIPLVPAARRSSVLSYLKDKPTSAAAEAIRNLRTSILLSTSRSAPKIIMSTSSVPGEGKTTQSVALAQNLAGMGKKVLLVECDIRRRVFREYFNIRQTRGLISAIAEPKRLEEFIHSAEAFGFDILIGERTAVNAADLFSSSKFKKLLTATSKLYDVVIIDTPPVLAVPDARIIGQSADVVLYSVQWDKTPKPTVLDGLRTLRQVGVRVTGMVLSQVNPKKLARYGYESAYASYASSERAYYSN